MEELIIQVVGQVMVYDANQWHPAGTCGLSTVRLVESVSNNAFKIYGHKMSDANEVVLNAQISKGTKFNKSTDTFIQWNDSHGIWGINFRKNSPDADNFYRKIVQIMSLLNQSPPQQPIYPIKTNDITNHNHQQLQQPTTSSAAIIQRSIQQQQQITQQPPQAQHQPPGAQQQQQLLQHMLNQQQQLQQQQQQQLQQQPQAMLSQAPPMQLLQQQQQPQPQQQSQPLLQQQLHQHYIQQQQQQPQAQSLTNQNQINHYQHPHQAQMKQQQAPHQQQVQHPQATAVVSSAPIPPPPPPPPPAPPAGALNNARVNGTSNNSGPANSTEAQHSPILTNNNNNILAEGNGGGSPSQVSSLASELAKCQLKKVNLSRSDSEKESECNNNVVGNPKTTRAASLAYVPDNLMNDLSKKLASRRERLDQQGDNLGGASNHSSNSNGNGADKSHDGWLAELIRKEITREMGKMKAEIIDAIKSELKQR